MQVEKESKSVGLEKEDSLNQARWRVGVGEIAVYGDKLGSKLDDDDDMKIWIVFLSEWSEQVTCYF